MISDLTVHVPPHPISPFVSSESISQFRSRVSARVDGSGSIHFLSESWPEPTSWIWIQVQASQIRPTYMLQTYQKKTIFLTFMWLTEMIVGYLVILQNWKIGTKPLRRPVSKPSTRESPERVSVSVESEHTGSGISVSGGKSVRYGVPLWRLESARKLRI